MNKKSRKSKVLNVEQKRPMKLSTPTLERWKCPNNCGKTLKKTRYAFQVVLFIYILS